jgi:hypothetical protein
VEDVAEVAGLGLGHRPLEQGDALVVASTRSARAVPLLTRAAARTAGQPTASARGSDSPSGSATWRAAQTVCHWRWKSLASQ